MRTRIIHTTYLPIDTYTYIQIFMNGTRLGCYPTLKGLFNYDGSESLANFARGLSAGAISGGMGAVVGSPFFMIKCRLQVQSTAAGADGFQHHYKGMVDGLTQVCGNAIYVRVLRKGFLEILTHPRCLCACMYVHKSACI